MRKLTLLCVLIGIIACGKGGPTNPTASTTGLSSLAVRIQEQIGSHARRPVAGTVRLLTTANQQVATQDIAEGQTAEFRNLADAEYKVWGEGFGFAQTMAAVNVTGNVATDMVLPATFAVRLLRVTADGREVKSGDTVEYPTNLAIEMEFMNPETEMWGVFGKFYLVSLGVSLSPLSSFSDLMPQGLHSVSASKPGARQMDYQTCNYVVEDVGSVYLNVYYTDHCLTRSDQLILAWSSGGRNVVVPRQTNLDFVVNWRRETP